MADRWRWRALRLTHGPGELWLVPAETLGEMIAAAREAIAAFSAKEATGGGDGSKKTAGADRGQPVEPQRLPLEQALALFDGSFREATFALRAFVRDNGLGPGVGLVREHHLLSHVRQRIAVGALVAVRPAARAAPPAKRPSALRAPAASSASSAAAPTPIRRGPAPPPASPEDEGPEFNCPGPQAQALREAAEAGVPFCAECQRAAAARAASSSRSG